MCNEFLLILYFCTQMYTSTTMKMHLVLSVISLRYDRSKHCHIFNKLKTHILHGYRDSNAIYRINRDTK